MGRSSPNNSAFERWKTGIAMWYEVGGAGFVLISRQNSIVTAPEGFEVSSNAKHVQVSHPGSANKHNSLGTSTGTLRLDFRDSKR